MGLLYMCIHLHDWGVKITVYTLAATGVHHMPYRLNLTQLIEGLDKIINLTKATTVKSTLKHLSFYTYLTNFPSDTLAHCRSIAGSVPSERFLHELHVCYIFFIKGCWRFSAGIILYIYIFIFCSVGHCTVMLYMILNMRKTCVKY